ncbi:hypothetical protein Patl1_00259 [Pistacia atlantica]|uniref:Uncharacterized protein n=1 Tax=Pistacia atlantica TaxID=434234 RepID=A0ACC1C6I3_9ROSI|nr:hypothetical protein Patl1_00259 [Pistacia atlantica]
MACWSSENATRAYLQALKMGKRGKEPDVAEFISALAAGNNAQLMVVACSSVAVSTTLALVAAAHQTGGRVVCILHGLDIIHSSKNALGPYANSIEFVVGDAQNLLVNEYRGADFVLIDCNSDVHKGIFRAAQESTKHGGGVIVGYNALHKGSWSEFNTQFLPIGNGLLVTKTTAFPKVGNGNGDGEVNKGRKRSRWVVTVDKCTGEEHVFRITSSHHQRVIRG